MKNVEFNSKATTPAPNSKNNIVLATAIEITVAVVVFSLLARALRPATTPVYYVVSGGTSTTQQQS